MKKIILYIFSLLLLIAPNSLAKVTSFDVKLEPRTVWVWETVDLTIKALDENWNVDKNYDWEIVVVEWDNTSPDEISFPWFENPDFANYKFTPEDQWVKKFENAISFKKPWKKWVNVWEAESPEDGPIWWDSIIVTWDATENWNISITSPNDNETFSKNTIKIVWQTQKNHKVKIKVNDTDEYETISNDSWVFEKELSWLPDWWNTIQAFLINWEWKKIWKSNILKIEIQTNWPAFRWITITPEENLKPWDEIKAVVLADPELNSVNLIIDDVVYTLDEKMEWKYEAVFSAPNKAWEYPIDLKLKDDLGNTNNKVAIKTIKVVWEAKTPAKKDEPQPKPQPEKKETPKNTNTPCEEAQITNLQLTELKTKSILSWNKVNDAIWYNLYKKSDNWEYNFFEKVDTNRIVIPIVGKEKKYDYFKIKAICKKKWKEIESKEYSKATKIQTWPVEIILLLLSLLLSWWIFLFINRKKIFK